MTSRHNMPSWLEGRLKKLQAKDKKFQLYDWILRALDAVEASNERFFLACCSPSSGKTVFGILCAIRFLSANPGGKIIIQAPSKKIADQWAKEAHKWGLNIKQSHEWTNDLDSDYDGVAITYQKLSKNAYNIKKFCQYHKVCVISDEIHHLGEDLSWYKAMLQACEVEGEHWGVKQIIGLTGTPFRSDDLQMPFIKYSEDGFAIANFKYSYREGMNAGHCRFLQFDCLNAEMEWVSMDRRMVSDFKRHLNESETSRRLNAALDMGFNFAKQLLGKSVKKLLQVRKLDPRAALLVVAKDTKHADKIEKHLKLTNPSLKIVTIHSTSSEKPHSELDDFDKSDAHICICVDMVTEGVNIRRLRVLCYASNKATLLRFIQTVHRLTRRIGKTDKMAWVYMPSDPRFMDHARDVLTEVFKAIDLEEKENKNTVSATKEKTAPSNFFTIGSEATDHELVYGENGDARHYTDDQRRYAEEFVVKYATFWRVMKELSGIPEDEDVPVGKVCEILEKTGRLNAIEVPPVEGLPEPQPNDNAVVTDDQWEEAIQGFDLNPVDDLTLEQKKSYYKNEIQQAFNKLAGSLKIHPDKYWVMHKLYMSLGHKKQQELTLDELKAKKEWAENRLRGCLMPNEVRLVNQMLNW